MKHYSLAALALGLTLASAACAGNTRNPIRYPDGRPRTTVNDRNGDGRDDRTGEVINKNKSNRDGARCNAGNGNGNGNGRCRNGNRGRGNGNGRGNE